MVTSWCLSRRKRSRARRSTSSASVACAVETMRTSPMSSSSAPSTRARSPSSSDWCRSFAEVRSASSPCGTSTSSVTPSGTRPAARNNSAAAAPTATSAPSSPPFRLPCLQLGRRRCLMVNRRAAARSSAARRYRRAQPPANTTFPRRGEPRCGCRRPYGRVRVSHPGDSAQSRARSAPRPALFATRRRPPGRPRDASAGAVTTTPPTRAWAACPLAARRLCPPRRASRNRAT